MHRPNAQLDRANERSMRLLQASKAYHPHIGGVETVVRQTAEGLAELGWDSNVLVANESRRSAHTSYRGVAVHSVPTIARVLSLPLAPTYGVALRRATADVLLIHEPTLLASASLFLDRASLRSRFGRLIVWWHSDI